MNVSAKHCLLFFICLLFNAAVAAKQTGTPTELEAVQTSSKPHTVAYIYDGDTIRLANGQRVRLLGINTPEINSQHSQAEAGGEAARVWLRDKVQDKVVFLHYDQQRTDRYGRQLAHVFLANGEHINLSLLQAGLAWLTIIPPNTVFLDQLMTAQKQAEQEGKGIWSMAAYKTKSVADLVSQRKTKGWQRYLVKVKDIKPGNKFVRLLINTQFEVRIPKRNLALFGNLKTYLHRRMEVRGWLSKYKDQYSILVRHPSDIIFP